MTRPPKGLSETDDELRHFVGILAERVDQLAEENVGLRSREADWLVERAQLLADNQDLKDEVARLKHLPRRPKFKSKPSGMEKATEPGAREKSGKATPKKPRGKVKDKLEPTATVKLKIEAPAGSRHRGYKECLVQELEIRTHVIRYLREVWETPTGERIVAPMPDGVVGGFGPELRRFIAAGCFQGQVTSERLVALLKGMGIAISKRQLLRLLNETIDALVEEDNEVLRTGLETAHWISVDDTGARHARKNGYTTQMGDTRFTAFRTTTSKSRINFLTLLQAGTSAFTLNAAAFDKMHDMSMAAELIERLAQHPDQHFGSVEAWDTHLAALGFDQLKVTPNPVKVATEAALWGAICEQGMLGDTAIVSDGAGQFVVGSNHCSCWIHAERLVYKLQPTSEKNRLAQEKTRGLIWDLYADLKVWKENPDPDEADALRARFDTIFTTKTGYPTLDRLLKRLHKKRDDLLRVLERPEVPLHTNGSENDIRTVVTKREVSGGTLSDDGRRTRDTMLGLLKTCKKLGVSFYDFLGDRFGVPGARKVPWLPALVRLAAV